MNGVQSLSGYGQTDAGVHIRAVRRAGQRPDASLLEAVHCPGACGLAVDAAVADQAEQRLLPAGVVHAGNSHPFSNFRFRKSLDYRAGILWLESIEDVNGDSSLHRRLNGGGIKHLCTVGSHVQGRLIRHFGDGAGGGDLLGVCRHDARHVRPDFQPGRLRGGGVKCGAEIGPSAPEGCHLAFVLAGDEARGYEDFHFGLEGNRRGNIIIGESRVVFDDEYAGVQPLGAEAFAAQLLGDDGGGE